MAECGHVEASDFLIIPRILYIGDSTVVSYNPDYLVFALYTCSLYYLYNFVAVLVELSCVVFGVSESNIHHM